MFTRQVEVQMGKNTLINIITMAKMPTLAANKHPCIHLFIHKLRLFHLPTKIVRASNVRDGHQSAYSGTNTKNTSTNTTSKCFP